MYKNKYNMAWTKLFEFISNNQKDEAFALYRLISSHMKDQALATKIKGDIYLFFEDQNTALDYYLKSKEIYNLQENYNQVDAIKICIEDLKLKKL